MTGDRWTEVEAIVLEAVERDGRERNAFLDDACRNDEELRREVESLLRFEGDAQRFLQRSAMETAAELATADVALDAAQLRIDGYEISEFIGAGGMGEVYAARDLRLQRDVALKIIRSTPEDAASRARLEEEARAASRRNHPNIVTIHAVGSQHDLSYIVMELVTGQTLRDLMAVGPLPLSSTVNIAAQLAEGLAAAHDLAVVHRDLKPENVMVTPGGLVKILDFGIARRDAVRPFPSGSLAGTAGYMSPEQAARGTLDHRSDQYSFGAIVYEMVTGKRIPDRDSQSGSAAQRQPVEPPLGAIVDRCLSANPDDRYRSTHDLAAAVRQVRDTTIHGGTRRFSRRQILATAAVAGAAVAAVLWRRPFGDTTTHRLAVLPFVNLSKDESTEILCDGITRVLIRQLTRVKNLSVIGESSVFRLKGASLDPRELARQLGVDRVLTGSVLVRGERGQLDVELVDAGTGARLWGEAINRPALDVLAVQNEIAATILTQGLGIAESDATLRELSGGLTTDPEAYRLFHQAIHHFRLDTEMDYLVARDLLTRAVRRDRTFALAHLTLASTYSVMIIDGFEAPRTAWPQAHQYVDLALAQDPQLPDAHAERGAELFYYQRDWAGAQREWEQALQSRRGEVQGELLSTYVLQQLALGRNEDALRFAKAAISVDPLSPMLANREADVLAAMGDTASAVERYTAIIASAPDDNRAYFGLAQVRRAQGRLDDAIAALRMALASSGDETLADILDRAHGDEGYRTIDRYLATRTLADLSERESAGNYASPLERARAHARLNEPAQAFHFLDASFDDSAAGLVFLNIDPAWDNIRHDRRFGDAIRRAGLPQSGTRG